MVLKTKNLLDEEIVFKTTENNDILLELQKWQERGRLLEEKIISYNWEYRKKICMNCNKEKRKKLNCMAFSSFKDGLQETHCRNLIIARTKKFKKETMNIIDSHPLTQIINDNFKPSSVMNNISEQTPL